MSKRTVDLPDVRVGQVWEDCDKRLLGRRVKVVAVPSLDVPNPGEVKVTVEVVASGEHADADYSPSSIGKRRAVKLRRFRPNSTGYRLVSDAEARS